MFEPNVLSEFDQMVFNKDDDGGLVDEKLHRIVIIQGSIAEYRRVTMHNTGYSEPNEQLQVLRGERPLYTDARRL